MKIDEFKRHIAVYKIWRKRNMNGKFYHMLVFLNVIKSPTFEVEKSFHESRGEYKEVKLWQE